MSVGLYFVISFGRYGVISLVWSFLVRYVFRLFLSFVITFARSFCFYVFSL